MGSTEELVNGIVASAIRVPTSPEMVRRGLVRLILMNPTWTIEDLGKKTTHGASWVRGKLGIKYWIPGLPAWKELALSRLPVARQLELAETDWEPAMLALIVMGEL